jgi:hypothetical protein
MAYLCRILRLRVKISTGKGDEKFVFSSFEVPSQQVSVGTKEKHHHKYSYASQLHKN